MDFKMYDDIDLNLFKVFLAVAETGNISNAAKALYVTQPAISYNIKELENNLKVKLFVRKAKGVQLTQAGEQLLFYIKTAFNNIYTGKKIISSTTNLECGEIRIGIPSHIGSAILTDCITKFNEMYPNITFSIISKSSHDMIEMLDTKQLDLVIDSFPIVGNKYEIDTHSLFELSNCFVANNKFKDILLEAPVPIERLKDFPLLLPSENSAIRIALEEQLNYNSENFKPIMSVYSSELLLEFVKKGIGIGYCPRSVAMNMIKSGEIFEVFTEIQCPTTQVCLVYPPRYLTPASSCFINMLKQTTNAEIKKRAINILDSKAKKELTPQNLAFIFNVATTSFGIKDIHFNYEYFNTSKDLKYFNKLHKLGANITLNISLKDVDRLEKFCKYCQTVVLKSNLKEINIINNNIFYNDINLNEIIEGHATTNFILAINIIDSAQTPIKAVKKLILASMSSKITLQFNEPFVDTYDSRYTLRFIERPLKQIGFVQSSQNVNKRSFTYLGNNVIIRRNFCAVTSSKFNPDKYCGRFSSIGLRMDGKIKLCRFKDTTINILKDVQDEDYNSVKASLKDVFNRLGKECKYKNMAEKNLQ